jgi:hypothetical protein
MLTASRKFVRYRPDLAEAEVGGLLPLAEPDRAADRLRGRAATRKGDAETALDRVVRDLFALSAAASPSCRVDRPLHGCSDFGQLAACFCPTLRIAITT